jgi:hypothetical protein
LPKIQLDGNRKGDFAKKRVGNDQYSNDPTVPVTKLGIGLSRRWIVMITSTFDLFAVTFRRRVVEYDSDV